MNYFAQRLQGLCLIFLALMTFNNYARSLPESHPVNGGLTIIPLDLKQQPEIYYQDKKIAVIPGLQSNQWLLLIGIPLENQNPIQSITMKTPFKATMPFYVSEKFYNTQYLSIKNQGLVDPNTDDQQRIKAENEALANLYAKFSPRNPFNEDFKAPSHGPISSLFGLKRVYNKLARPPHSGLDIAAPEDSPVYVIASGQVVSTSDYFFTGNTVIVDHGMGLFSLYGHLKRIDVKVGSQIKQGSQVGIVGQTGRATGPHLHWSMILNQTLVDPLLFVPFRVITTLPKTASQKAG